MGMGGSAKGPEGAARPAGRLGRDEILRMHEEHLFPCVSTYYEQPLIPQSAEGMFIRDADGREYLDFFAGILTVGVGHCNPAVVEALSGQAAELGHVSTLYPTEAIVRLAARLADVTPGSLQKCFFTNSGTEADETAVLLARVATGRSEIIALRHAYAGRSQLAMSITAQAPWRRGPAGGDVRHALSPYCYRCTLGMTYPGCDLRCAHDIEELIQTTTAGAPAALMAEPIQGIGGFVTPPPEYFQVAVGIAREYGALFICDEVQTGFGRTGGKMFGIEHYGVEPDILTMAKGIANGVPLGATIATAAVADRFTGLSISTFGGNPISCAASHATIRYIEDHDLVVNAKVQGRRLREGLEYLRDKYPVIGDVRGMGLMQGLEMVHPDSGERKEPNAGVTAAVFEESRRRGLLMGRGGLYANIFRIAPPLIVTADQIDTALGIIDASFGVALGSSP